MNYGLNSKYLSIPQDVIDSVPDAFDDDFNKRIERGLASNVGKRYDEASLRAWTFIWKIAKDKQMGSIIIKALMHFLTDEDAPYQDSPYPIWAYPF